MGYLVRISFLGYNLKSYPDYHKISYNILSYPIISFHILSYPKISSGANSQMASEVMIGDYLRKSLYGVAQHADKVRLQA